MKRNIIEVDHYAKRFGDFTAVNDITFAVEEGSIFAFLGPNGAGKSTTINTLCTIIDKTAGSIKVNGHDIEKEKDKVRGDIGIVYQDTTLDLNLTVEENLKLHCDFYHVPEKEVRERIDFVLQLVDMEEWRRATGKGLSGGMKRRVEIARGLVHYPRVLFLDEPTTGLDPQTRSSIWEYIRKLQKQRNITIFLTTHYMEEAEICDHVAIIDHGRIAAYNTPYQLKKEYTTNTVKVALNNETGFKEYLVNKRLNFLYENGLFNVNSPSLEQIFGIITDFKNDIIDIEVHKGTLNEVFLAITGKEVRV